MIRRPSYNSVLIKRFKTVDELELFLANTEDQHWKECSENPAPIWGYILFVNSNGQALSVPDDGVSRQNGPALLFNSLQGYIDLHIDDGPSSFGDCFKIYWKHPEQIPAAVSDAKALLNIPKNQPINRHALVIVDKWIETRFRQGYDSAYNGDPMILRSLVLLLGEAIRNEFLPDAVWVIERTVSSIDPRQKSGDSFTDYFASLKTISGEMLEISSDLFEDLVDPDSHVSRSCILGGLFDRMNSPEYMREARVWPYNKNSNGTN